LHERGFAKTPEPGVENKNKRCQRAESEWKAMSREGKAICDVFEFVAVPNLATKLHSIARPVIPFDSPCVIALK
jgi:hypothetical protein